jgi:serine protein kinase
VDRRRAGRGRAGRRVHRSPTTCGHGTLAAKNRTIYEALLAGYQGDYLRVLRHVQVERFDIAQRYRTGWVTVEPQLSVDATERQLTADRSITALPPSLQSVALFEYGGDVVGANRGFIEYDDLLKRPLEHYKYLLTTVERGALAMAVGDAVRSTCASSPAATTSTCRRSARCPTSRASAAGSSWCACRTSSTSATRGAVRERLREAAGGRHVAPHTAYVAALWAVMTRMRKPQPERYSSGGQRDDRQADAAPQGRAVRTPAASRRSWGRPARELTALIADLWHEFDTYPIVRRVGSAPRRASCRRCILSTPSLGPAPATCRRSWCSTS